MNTNVRQCFAVCLRVFNSRVATISCAPRSKNFSQSNTDSLNRTPHISAFISSRIIKPKQKIYRVVSFVAILLAVCLNIFTIATSDACMVLDDQIAVQFSTVIVGVYGLSLPISQRHPVHLMFAIFNCFCNMGSDHVYLNQVRTNEVDKIFVFKFGLVVVNAIAFILSRPSFPMISGHFLPGLSLHR